MVHAKVLLIDDEEDFTRTLSQRLELRGVETSTAAGGAEALDSIESADFDAVVLDLQMPDMDGIETLKRLLAKNPKLQVILLTGHATVQKSVEAMKHGAADFLEKPVDIQRLIEKIQAAGEYKMLLVEKESSDMIQDILKSKGW